MKVVHFLIGLVVPFAINGLWFLFARNAGEDLRRKLTEGPGAFAVPILILVLCIVGIVIFWDSRQWLSYGLITAIAVALVVFGLYFAIRPEPTPPPPV